MGMADNDILHREGNSYGHRIALARLVGYSWEAIAEYWSSTPEQMKIEAKYFLEYFLREEL